MNALSENKSIVLATERQSKAQTRLTVFLEFIEAIPPKSPLRDSSGLLKPRYRDARNFFGASGIWDDFARMAHAATSRMTGGRVESITPLKDKMVSAFTQALAESWNHEQTLREFSLKLDQNFENVMTGSSGFKDSDDISNFQSRNEIVESYLLYLKPEWLDVEALKKYGMTLILAIHLADQILRKKGNGVSEQESAVERAASQPLRVVAIVRAMAEFLAQQAGTALEPNGQTILNRYLQSGFSLAASAAVSQEARRQAKIVETEQATTSDQTMRKPPGQIYREISERLAAEYTEKNAPKTIADVPERARRSIAAVIFGMRLQKYLGSVLNCDDFLERYTEMIKLPTWSARIVELERGSLGEEAHRPETMPLDRLLTLESQG